MIWLACVSLAAALVIVPDRRGNLLRIAPASMEAVSTVSSTRSKIDPLAIATTFDLLAACLRSGSPVATAAAAAAPSAPASFGLALRRASDLLALGAEPAHAWESVASDPATRSLARMVERSARSGSSMAAAMTELAAFQRIEAADASAAAAERAGVMISGPLGLCFLPAFICLGIVPVVIGLATKVLDGGLL